MSETVKKEISKEETKMCELAFFASIISGYLMAKQIKLGEEGIVQHYDIVATIAQKCLDRFPIDFDWETHYSKGADCIDVEVEKFADEYIKSEKLFINTTYWRDPQGNFNYRDKIHLIVNVDEKSDGVETGGVQLITVDATKDIKEQVMAFIKNYWNDEDVELKEDGWFVSWINRYHKLNSYKKIDNEDYAVMMKYL